MTTNKTLRKTAILVGVSCHNGFFSNNLFCEDICRTINPEEKKVKYLFDFSKDYQKASSDAMDYEQLIQYIGSLQFFDFEDEYLQKRMIDDIKHNQEILGYTANITLKIDKTYHITNEVQLKDLVKGRIEFLCEVI